MKMHKSRDCVAWLVLFYGGEKGEYCFAQELFLLLMIIIFILESATTVFGEIILNK